MSNIIVRYEDYLIHIKHASDNTVASYMRDLRQYASYLTAEGIDVLDADPTVVSGYMGSMKANGKSAATISRALANPPTMNAYYEDGTPVEGYNSSSQTPLFYDKYYDRSNQKNYLSLIGGLRWEIIDGLKGADNVSQLTHVVGGVLGMIFGFLYRGGRRR